MEAIKHFSHKGHSLILKELQVDDGLEKVVCYGCKQPVSSTYYYCCSECDKFFLHKSCAELPLEITHPMHSEHPLQLFSKSPYMFGSCICNVCRREKWTGFTYHCFKCEFDVDVLCAQLEGTLIHPAHHHRLKIQPRSALFHCDACGIEDKDESYDCTVCSFWIHKTCGSMKTNTLFKYHPHPLSLAYCFPEQYRHYNLKCDICREKLYLSYWVYYCGPCRYFFHLKCITSKSQEDEAAQANSNNNEEITPNFISLPVENLSSVLIKHFLEENGLPYPQVEPLSEIQHSSHQHPLILTTVEDDYYGFTEDDQETICNACVEPISGSCYACVECNFVIHLHCVHHLPKTLSSSLHPQHKLSICNPQDLFDVFGCSKCYLPGNGFFYKCEQCNFGIDIRCALLPATIKHEVHEHLLVQDGRRRSDYCHACNARHRDNFFSCKTCPNYRLASHCAMLPKSVGHRWDKHPLFLSYPPYYYHPDIFMCDICEKEIHPKYWLYHCRECDNSFHLNCIPRLEKYFRNVKFGDKFQIGDHGHPLTFTRKVEYKSSCEKCGRDMKGYDAGFICETCYLTICGPCVWKIVYSS